MLLFIVLVAGTLVSEDLTSISAGLLVQRGDISATSAIAACSIGIWVGDFGLWAVGRLTGAAALRWPPVERSLSGDRAVRLRAWLDRHAAGAIVGSRFLPGTRLPLYVAAGVLKFPPMLFAWWSLVGVALWTPTIVLLAATLGHAFTDPLARVIGVSWRTELVIIVGLVIAQRVATALVTRESRRRLASRVARWMRWEFWPMWLFYAPVAVWMLLLAIRHRGIQTITAANPGMPDGGIVGESKFDILSRLPQQWTIPAVHIPRGMVPDRLALAERLIASRGWSFAEAAKDPPDNHGGIVAKPDVGQRGVGVKLARTLDEIAAYLDRVDLPVLLQPYHPGPFEAGVFYYRMPGCERGRILSITDKQFPYVIGNGHDTIEELIWSHPRYRMQADLFMERHRNILERVPADRERVRLAIAGNHAQGTVFRDGRHLLTPALENRIDTIARGYDGFFVGRFDIRYTDVEKFKAGEDLAIVELNGATSESTNIYDPDGTLLSAYRQLFGQWSIVFAIGAANRAAGVPVSSGRRLLDLIRTHLSTNVAFAISD